jgi:hypothetical protein
MGNDPSLVKGVHGLLREAMFESAQADWPANPHFGGSKPRIPDEEQLGVAFLCADHVLAHLKEGDDRDKLARCIAHCRAHAGDAWKGGDEWRVVYWEIQLPRPAALSVAWHLTCAVEDTYGRKAPVAARREIALLQRYAVQALGGNDSQPSPTVRTLLLAIDDWLMCADLLGILADAKLVPTSPPVEILFCPRPKKGPSPLTLARLADGRYALWSKIKSRRSWVEGGAQEVLATIPDENFAAANDAVVKRGAAQR